MLPELKVVVFYPLTACDFILYRRLEYAREALGSYPLSDIYA